MVLFPNKLIIVDGRGQLRFAEHLGRRSVAFSLDHTPLALDLRLLMGGTD